MRGSALVYGNNKLQQVALGKSAEDELKEGVSRISKQLKFEKALLFTDLSDPQVRRRFDGYTPACHAKPGTTALSTVTLKKGPEVFLKWPASEENKFRELGLPVAVESGKIHLLEDITVCRVGETLTPQAAQLLKKVDAKTARLTVNIEDVWTNPDPVENKKKKKKQDNGGEGEGEEEDSGEEEEGGEEMEEAPGV
uniref:Large ribosomal subunit protein uL10-like insertion domain-containing protein n=1 Tax=Chromera velia CCMP2878 TaxID=1169474 RepID=A0A0G4GH86_9ALVE|eukprot:Cvel_4712.t1-p1 / transcript=Cvel_4712.t1 / gene=Cvel_4712 / organism=Chromera_velia_CCMP2878 / gene_product=mRNA turnover protein 4 homolog, putative / transcript_product=mRNA turnover protein 4 homolog, putative / location=Cvel_scaffold209:84440-85024(-) / protein_length=195 / sequence_SO=supercontig / SO=protein_coding / is_pseudo=false